MYSAMANSQALQFPTSHTWGLPSLPTLVVAWERLHQCPLLTCSRLATISQLSTQPMTATSLHCRLLLTTIHKPTAPHRKYRIPWQCPKSSSVNESWVRCSGEVFTVPLPTNGRLLLVKYWGLQLSCYNMNTFASRINFFSCRFRPVSRSPSASKLVAETTHPCVYLKCTLNRKLKIVDVGLLEICAWCWYRKKFRQCQ
jgi:hypothetical protein